MAFTALGVNLKHIHRLVMLCLITNGRQNVLLLRGNYLQCQYFLCPLLVSEFIPVQMASVKDEF